MDELPGAPHAEAAKQWGVVTELFFKPLSTLAQAKAEAYAIKTISSAQITATECEDRARRRRIEEELRWQVNLDAIGTKAVAMLPDVIETKERDPDWFSKFTDCAKHSSDDQIRELFAKVLAGEIVQPGRFSIRLLQTINFLRKDDAVRFHDFCNYVWRDQKGSRFLLYDDNSLPMLKARFGGREPWLGDFHELGLTVVMGILGNLYPKESGLLCYGGKAYSFFDWKLPKGVHSPVLIPLTTLGRELMDLCDPKPDPEYLSLVGHGMFGPHEPPPSPWPWPDVKPNY